MRKSRTISGCRSLAYRYPSRQVNWCGTIIRITRYKICLRQAVVRVEPNRGGPDKSWIACFSLEELIINTVERFFMIGPMSYVLKGEAVFSKERPDGFSPSKHLSFSGQEKEVPAQLMSWTRATEVRYRTRHPVVELGLAFLGRNRICGHEKANGKIGEHVGDL